MIQSSLLFVVSAIEAFLRYRHHHSIRASNTTERWVGLISVYANRNELIAKQVNTMFAWVKRVNKSLSWFHYFALLCLPADILPSPHRQVGKLIGMEWSRIGRRSIHRSDRLAAKSGERKRERKLEIGKSLNNKREGRRSLIILHAGIIAQWIGSRCSTLADTACAV